MSLAELNYQELCPNCGKFVDSLNELTGFCDSCSPKWNVGFPSERTPQPNKRLKNWLTKNAEEIEKRMLADGLTAKVAISEIAQISKAVCLCCGDEIPHGTKGRHVICNKRTKCRKARRYYSYLKYEKGHSKQEALEKALKKFRQ